MRNGLFALLTLLSFASVATAQAPDAIAWSRSAARASVGDVVARLMQFDRDSDGRVARTELIERMQQLVTRGDANGDDALDGAEILVLANAPVPLPTRLQLVRDGFGDEISLSSRSHIEGAFEDLRLAGSVRERAINVVEAFVNAKEAAATAGLLKEMEGVLTAEQMVDFSEALDGRLRRQSPSPFVDDRPTDADRLLTLSLQTAFLPIRGTCPGAGVFCNPTPGTFKAGDGLTTAAALKRLKAQLSLDDAQRSELLEQLRGILSDEEQDDFRAALERRPLAKTAGL